MIMVTQGASIVQLEDYFEQVGPDAIRLKGHRVGIEHLLHYYLDGYTVEEINQLYPEIGLAQIHATILYYLQNRATIDAYRARLAVEADTAAQAWAASSPLAQRLQAVRRRQEVA